PPPPPPPGLVGPTRRHPAAPPPPPPGGGGPGAGLAGVLDGAVPLPSPGEAVDHLSRGELPPLPLGLGGP
ncbi:hypothetical protein LCD31_28630, partial [Saccharopolyspora sp. 6M]|nr:hypothetical protein [Saccharopolyspora sp. 6M]